MNKESSWQDCLASGASARISPDIAKARSLKSTSEGRIAFLKELPIKESNANYIFEGYYSSMLELMHGMVLVEGYAVSNHLCLGFYLRDILHNPALFRLFDGCRYKRNSLVYYGKKMDFETAKEAIEKCKTFIEALRGKN